jgi:hypothetical protein
MKIQWTTAALLSCALLAGCNDRGNDNAQNLEQTQDQAPATGAGAADQVNPATPAAPAPSTAPTVDNSAARADRNDTTTGARATTGSRPTTRPAPAAPTTRNNNGVVPDIRPRETATPSAPARPQFREVTIPAGTSLPLELTTALSSTTATVEMPVTARLRQAIVIDGQTAIPAGSTLHGEVFEVERAGRVRGRSHIAVRFSEVQMTGGVRENLRTNPVNFEGEASKGEDATKVGVGAGVGAAIGGLLGGGSGAAKGAAIGGAAGAGTVLATRGREIELATGTDIEATLASPLEVQISLR